MINGVAIQTSNYDRDNVACQLRAVAAVFLHFLSIN